MSILYYLQRKWKLENLMQVFAILCVFTLTGTTVLLLRPLFFDLIGIGSDTKTYVKVASYIVLILPMYQLLLLGYGWVFGQYKFFLSKIKRVTQRASIIFRK
ncbi:hypothetical protein SAMN05661096_00608 [Marivirga sericea]|uniref:DUF6787 domain-containing protein n=1 Tax=Marivirga sericea TaxID=1028 RepID=A0A1X7IGH8_9BACT|nr:DUF6787 family protein [Marivirga sericea]SMG13629.1 hypothetical protein SAMN05661096_00608 [Marivirga sericea]